MNIPNATDFGYYVTKYLSDYLPHQTGASKNTLLSYRDTFSLLLEYLEKVRKMSSDKITIAQLDGKLIADFLAWLQTARKYSVSSRNHRLAVLRAFFKYLQAQDPKYLSICQSVLGVKFKKTASKLPEFLTKEAIAALLDQPDIGTPDHYRDLIMLTLMYDTGARVQEIVDLRICDIKLNDFPSVTLTGKGSKTRSVPIMSRTAEMLERYIATLGLKEWELREPLFRNHRREKLTRNGVTYILAKYARQAHKKHPNLLPDSVSPHMLRHSKAMHMVQSGVNTIYIRDFLGHTNIKATEVYARADGEMKRIAIAKAGNEKITSRRQSWNNDAGLMAWLKDYGR